MSSGVAGCQIEWRADTAVVSPVVGCAGAAAMWGSDAGAWQTQVEAVVEVAVAGERHRAVPLVPLFIRPIFVVVGQRFHDLILLEWWDGQSRSSPSAHRWSFSYS